VPDGLAVMQQSSCAYMAVGNATPYIADINGTVISYKVSSLCLDTTATGGEEQRKNIVVVLQYGRRPVSTLTYQQIFYLQSSQRAIRQYTAVQPTVC